MSDTMARLEVATELPLYTGYTFNPDKIAKIREKLPKGGQRELSLSCVCCVAVRPGDRLLAVGGEDEPDRRVRQRPDQVRLERQGLRDAPAWPDRVDAAEVQIKRCLFTWHTSVPVRRAARPAPPAHRQWPPQHGVVLTFASG